MDKTPVAARQLISNMEANYQQFDARVAAPSSTATNELFYSMVVDNQRLEDKLTEFTSLVR